MTPNDGEKRLEDTSAPARGQGAEGSTLPDVARANVTYYAYDPASYEILCRPGQRLSQKKAQRLQELELYAHVVTFLE